MTVTNHPPTAETPVSDAPSGSQAPQQQSLLRWLWDRGLPMYTMALFVIASAVIFEATAPETVPDWLSTLAAAAGGSVFIRAGMRAGPAKEDQ